MATHTWTNSRATGRIESRLEEVKDVTIKDFTRDMSLESIPANKAYRVDGVQLYADILNLGDILNVTGVEGETCHKRTKKFLNLHYRAVHRILADCDALRVDFHNQRLHALVYKPYNSEKDAEAKRIRRAVAISQLIIDVLQETGDDDNQIPNAKVRIGIDSGNTLAVNNGRRQGREPLFLGHPANFAAKLANSTKTGIYLSNNARKTIGLEEFDEPKNVELTPTEICECQKDASLDCSKDGIVKKWRQDLLDNPLGAIAFSGHTPPMSTLNISLLSLSNSRRQDLVSMYADIDGFTKYVQDHLDESTEDVVRTLHVIRAELDSVLSSDFKGRKIRFIGDCLHGVMCEGTAQTTEKEETISDAALCAGGLRSSFELALEKLQENDIKTGSLGLAIGFEYGPTVISRMGMQGSKVRCCISRTVLASEEEQLRCTGIETAIGKVAYDGGTDAIRKLFGTKRKNESLDYNEVVEALADKGDKTARAAKDESYSSSAPAVATSAYVHIKPHTC